MRVSRCRARGRGVSSACVFRTPCTRRRWTSPPIVKTRDAPRRTGARRASFICACVASRRSSRTCSDGRGAFSAIGDSESSSSGSETPRRTREGAEEVEEAVEEGAAGTRATGGHSPAGGGEGVGVEGARPRRAREEVGAIAAGGPHARGMATAMTGATFARGGGAVAVAAEAEVAATSVTSAGRRDTGRTTVRTRDDERVWRERVTGHSMVLHVARTAGYGVCVHERITERRRVTGGGFARVHSCAVQFIRDLRRGRWKLSRT